MANVKSWVVSEYEDDFGNSYENLSFKVEIIDDLNINAAGAYDEPSSRRVSCGTKQFFSMRKLVAIFNDGKSIELPIPSLNDVEDYISAWKTTDDVACVSLKGERWRVVPPGVLGGGSYATDGIAVANKPESIKYVYSYKLDANGSSIVRTTSVEESPAEVATAQASCLDVIANASQACSITQGFDARKFIGIRANTTTGRKLARQIIVSSNEPDTIKTCGADNMPTFNCLAYIGQTMANASDFYA